MLMTIVETTPQDYDLLFGKNPICFQTAAFNAMNGSKCEEVLYLLFEDPKLRLGLVAGVKGKRLLSPFSAPFGGFSFLDKKLSVRHVEEAVDALMAYCRKRGLEEIGITLPPLVYNESCITKMQHVFYQKGFQTEALDMDYIFYPDRIFNDYSTKILARNAKKNLRIALSRNFHFRAGSGDADLMKAYEIIRQNRLSRNFHISMTAEEILQTSRLVKVDSFIVSLQGQEVASAIVYHVTSDILQVVYWGDLPEYASNKTMNYLSYKVFEYYGLKGYETIDVGPGMIDNMPNYGLCDFKESIGCSIQPKMAFHINLLR